MSDDNVTHLPPRKKELATVTAGKESTLFDQDGNMRKVAPEHAKDWRSRFLESFSEDVQREIEAGTIAVELVDRARDVLYRMLEEESWRLVFEPPQRPVYQRGELVGFEPIVQTKHVEWMLERHLPERYHLATKTELLASGGKGISFTFQMGDQPLEIEEGEFEETGDDAA